MTDVHVLYITRKLHDIKLCSHYGRVCMIVPNYTEVFEAPIVTGDESVSCYRIEVPTNEVLQQQDGAAQKLYLWLGDTHARSRPQDMLTLPCESLAAVGSGGAVASAPGAMDPRESAAALFAGYSEEVKLAAVLTNAPASVISALPDAKAELKAWAGKTLAATAKAG